jgi:hypothetical protein
MGSPRRISALGAGFLVAALVGCATGGSSGPRGSSEVLTAEEMEPWAGQDLYTVIQRLRPQWILARKGVTFTERIPISVVVDGIRVDGNVEGLGRFRAGDVAEARYLNASDATTLYGIGMMSGAIVVRTKRGGP